MKSKNPRKKIAKYAFTLNSDTNIIPNIVKRKRKTIKPTITAKGENLYWISLLDILVLKLNLIHSRFIFSIHYIPIDYVENSG